MSRTNRIQLKNRAMIALLITCILGFGAGAYGVINAGIINGNEYKKKAESQQLSDTTVSAKRGTIYDSNMNVLAESADAWKIWVNPSKMEDDATRKDIAENLASILELDYDTVYEKCCREDYAYVLIESQVDYDKKEQIIEFRSSHKGYNSMIGADDDVKRYYPYGSFAATVLGFTGTDDTGLSGLEYYYNTVLTGTKGRIVTAKNAKQISMTSDYSAYYEAEEGLNLQLTIDQVMQYYLDSALSDAVELHNASYGYGIIMDTKTGAILAMSSQPDFDLNEPYEIASEKTLEAIAELETEEERNEATIAARYAQWRNRTICDSYEPGSVFKVITAAAALEEGVVTPDEMFCCTGSYQVKNITYHCSHVEGHGTEDFTTAMMNSCNPIFIEVAQRLGSEKFYKYFEAFGFSETTGIDLPAESTPTANVTYYTADKLTAVSLASCSFGQSFQVSPIQTITAINAIANGGKLMKPYVVAAMLDSDGNKVYETEPVEKRQVISEQTADTLCEMLEEVVTAGTAKNAYVAGYRVAGKTGTSQKLTSDDGYYIASFCGFAPADDPEITVLIVIDEPKNGSFTGGSVAGPVAAEVIEKCMQYLNVEPQYSDEELAKLDVETADVVGKTVEDANKELTSSGFTVKVIGSGNKVLAQSPAAGQKIPKNGVVVVYTDSATEKETVTVPDLSGLSVTEANNALIAAGLNMKRVGYTTGSNIKCYKQSVEAGSELPMGSIITLSFMTEINEED